MKQLSKASKGPAFNLVVTFLMIFSMSWDLLSLKVFSLQGVEKSQLVQGQVCHILTGITSLLWQNEQANCCAKGTNCLSLKLAASPSNTTSITLQYLYIEVTVYCCSFWHTLCYQHHFDPRLLQVQLYESYQFWCHLQSPQIVTECPFSPSVRLCGITSYRSSSFPNLNEESNKSPPN